jgi:propanol-preferring alcohol dehydrogenase
VRAAVVREFGAPLVLEDRPIPTPGPGDVVIQVEACGLCHTDLYAAQGDWPERPTLPFVPGHEAVGTVDALGAGVTHLRRGDRVALPSLGWACGRCAYCLSGSETLCRQRRTTGYDIDGGFADYVRADADFVVRVPAGVDALDAAGLSCAGVNAYRAVALSGAGPCDLTAVFGIGGVGHLAVQYARIAGSTVVGVDIRADKLRMAEDLGASHTFDAATSDPVEAIQRLGGADQAIVTAVSATAGVQALTSLRPGGTLVLVAIPPDHALALPVFDTVRRGISILGSVGGTRVDLADVLALHAQGRTRVVHEARALSQVNEAFKELDTDNVPARLVFEFR